MTDKKLKEIWIKYGFPNIGKFTQILKEKNYNYGYKDIQNFLEKQDTYQQHKGKKIKQYGHITAFAPNELWQADLIDYQKYADDNDGYKWLLIGIDVYTRIGFAEKIKSKRTEDVVHALKRFFGVTKQRPKVLMTDNGKEFTGEAFQNFLDKNKIMHTTNQIHDHRALGVIDRFVRTIKTMIEKQFTYYGDNNWTKYYKAVIDHYNKTPHSGLNGVAPNEAEKYRATVDYINILKRQKMNMIKNAYKVGDTVRVRVDKDRKFAKGYKPVWSKEKYKVIKVIGKSYELDDGTGKRHRQYNIIRVSEGEEE